MAKDETLTEDDDLEIVEVDKLPTAEEIAARAAEDADGDEGDGEHDDDADGEEDTRLAEHEDDTDKTKREKRKQRRESQKAARDRTLAELDTLRREVAELKGLAPRMTAIETHTVGMTERQIADKLEEGKRKLSDFEAIIAKSIEDGDGAGATAAMRMRDETRDEVRTLETTAQQIKTNRETKSAPDTRIKENADAWKRANPWYDARGVDANSAIVNAIDNQLVAEKFDPATPGYWQELTRRVSAKMKADDDGEERGAKREERSNGRKGPPVGGERSAGTPGKKNEVYVTPERKAAMVEAGIWDDPVRRAKMLKSYRDYDAQNSAR